MQDGHKNSGITAVSISITVFLAYCFYQILVGNGNSSIRNGLLLLFIGSVLYSYNWRIKIPREKSLYRLILSLVYMTVSYFFSKGLSSVSYGRILALYIISVTAIFFVLICNIVTDFAWVIKGFSFVMIFSTFYSLISIGFNNLFRLIVSGSRIIDVYGSEYGTNYSAMIACVSALIAIYNAMVKRNRLFYLLALPGIILCMASGSRKALISILLGVLFLLMLMAKKKSAFTLIKRIIALGILLFVMYQIPAFDAITQRISTLWNSNLDASVGLSDAGRMNRIKWGFSQFLKSPIWGYGFDSFAYYYGHSFGVASYAHNNYIQILFDQGLIGFLLYYGYIYQIIKELFILRGKGDNGGILLLTLCLVTLVFDFGSVTYYQFLSRLIYMIAGGYIIFAKKLSDISIREIDHE